MRVSPEQSDFVVYQIRSHQQLFILHNGFYILIRMHLMVFTQNQSAI
jgi:hypothetical protein